MSEKLMLGDTALESYLSFPEKLGSERELDVLIGKLEKSCMNVEEIPFKLLMAKKMQYPLLDPGFLSMGNYSKKYEVTFPKFSVYSKSESGFNPFSIRFNTGGNFVVGYMLDMDMREKIPILLAEQLIKMIGIRPKEEEKIIITKLDGRGRVGGSYNVPRDAKETWKKYRDLNDIEFVSNFNGIIPTHTKEKIIQAERIFGDKTYLISETFPEEWNAVKIKTDPLVVGIIEETRKMFLIDHFNTTPFEDYVRKEFSF